MNTNRPMSEVLAIVLAHAETSSSLLIGLDSARRLGDLVEAEHHTANRRIGKWLQANEDMAFQTFGVKKAAFKQLIKEEKANESMANNS